MNINHPPTVIEGLADMGLECYGQYKTCEHPENCEYSQSCQVFADTYSACERWCFSINPHLGESMDEDESKSYQVEYYFEDEEPSVDREKEELEDRLDILRLQMHKTLVKEFKDD